MTQGILLIYSQDKQLSGQNGKPSYCFVSFFYSTTASVCFWYAIIGWKALYISNRFNKIIVLLWKSNHVWYNVTMYQGNSVASEVLSGEIWICFSTSNGTVSYFIYIILFVKFYHKLIGWIQLFLPNFLL